MERKEGSNLIAATLAELTQMGYKKIKGRIRKNDLLCATKTAQDLWIELDKNDTIRPSEHLVLRKSK